MPRQIPKVGDVFAVPLDDGTFCIGQVMETDPILMNSITCAFFDIRLNLDSSDVANLDLSERSAISCQFVTRDLFNRGTWKRLGNTRLSIPERLFPYRETKRNGWIGATVVGSGIINTFLSAYYGLREWKEMKDPEYYDKLLLKDRRRPNA